MDKEERLWKLVKAYGFPSVGYSNTAEWEVDVRVQTKKRRERLLHLLGPVLGMSPAQTIVDCDARATTDAFCEQVYLATQLYHRNRGNAPLNHHLVLIIYPILHRTRNLRYE